MIAYRITALAGVLLGCLILAIGGGGAPTWLNNMLALLFIGLAGVYGFTAFVPSAPAWLTSRPVVGALAIWAGAAFLFVPSNILCSAASIAFGTRLLMFEKRSCNARVVIGTGLATRRTETVIAEVES